MFAHLNNSISEKYIIKYITKRPIWQFMNHLPIYANYRNGDLSNVVRLEDRAVILPTNFVLELLQ